MEIAEARKELDEIERLSTAAQLSANHAK